MTATAERVAQSTLRGLGLRLTHTGAGPRIDHMTDAERLRLLRRLVGLGDPAFAEAVRIVIRTPAEEPRRDPLQHAACAAVKLAAVASTLADKLLGGVFVPAVQDTMRDYARSDITQAKACAFELVAALDRLED